MSSKKADKLKKAGADMDKFFSGSSGDDDIQVEFEEKKKVSKVFSFRADADQIEDWKIWADAKGMKISELGTRAINEYMRRHKLTDDQRAIYELRLGQKK